MRVEALKVVLKVQEIGDFGKVVKKLKSTPLDVSQQIIEVEREIGFRIFERDSFALTSKGATFLLFASQAVALLEEGVLEAIMKG